MNLAATSLKSANLRRGNKDDFDRDETMPKQRKRKTKKKKIEDVEEEEEDKKRGKPNRDADLSAS